MCMWCSATIVAYSLSGIVPKPCGGKHTMHVCGAMHNADKGQTCAEHVKSALDLPRAGVQQAHTTSSLYNSAIITVLSKE